MEPFIFALRPVELQGNWNPSQEGPFKEKDRVGSYFDALADNARKRVRLFSRGDAVEVQRTGDPAPPTRKPRFGFQSAVTGYAGKTALMALGDPSVVFGSVSRDMRIVKLDPFCIGESLRTWQAYSVAISADERLGLAGSPFTIYVLDLTCGKVLYSVSGNGEKIALSSDGTRAAFTESRKLSVAKDVLAIWDTTKACGLGRLIVEDATWFANSAVTVGLSIRPFMTVVWDLISREPITQYETPSQWKGDTKFISMSGDGTRAILRGDRAIVWDVSSGKQVAELSAPTSVRGAIEGLEGKSFDTALNWDGTIAAACCYGRSGTWIVRLWRIAEGAEIAHFSTEDRLDRCYVSPCGSIVFAAPSIILRVEGIEPRQLEISSSPLEEIRASREGDAAPQQLQLSFPESEFDRFRR